MNTENTMAGIFDETFDMLETALDQYRFSPGPEVVGKIASVGMGVVEVSGLKGVKADEVLQFSGGISGWAFNIDEDRIGVIMLEDTEQLFSGGEVRRTHRLLDIPAGDALIGRVTDPLGRPRDEKGVIPGSDTGERWFVERPAPPIMDRAPVTRPLQTGLKVVDTLVPIGRGQRELILGDRQTGKTAIAIDTILNQKKGDLICIYCGIGKKSADLARVVSRFEENGAMEYSMVVMTTEEDPAGLQFIAPYAATTIGEYFMEKGKDVLVVYDDLTRHARAYRELSLLLRRPPGREAFPGDIFYVHSRLLERSTHLSEERGGGSLTALPVIETEAQNMSAYIPTNLISITDGQVYLSPELFRKGVLPAVDVGKSVSRVGGKTQVPAYRAVAGSLRLSYSQFEELESFARFGTRLDKETEKSLERGRRVREILKQKQYHPLSVPKQIAVLSALNKGAFDDIPLNQVGEMEEELHHRVREECPDFVSAVEKGEKISDADIREVLELAETIKKNM